ncbi:MAG: hypothetical protein DHS20C08_20760 [Rhodomicrobium sp.]|nr:MAG: hypothetical protein DHS20C08_20760 [Rhodomicrobium sp.]
MNKPPSPPFAAQFCNHLAKRAPHKIWERLPERVTAATKGFKVYESKIDPSRDRKINPCGAERARIS